MGTKLERIADKSAHESRPVFTSLYQLLNEELLLECHRGIRRKQSRLLELGRYAKERRKRR